MIYYYVWLYNTHIGKQFTTTGHLWVRFIKEFFFEFFMTKLECFRRFEECQQSRANDLLKDSSWKPIRIVKMKEGFGDGTSEKIIYVLANETPA